MARSLFLFDMTFWLYLAALVLYVTYMLAKRPAMQLAPAGHPVEYSDGNDSGWAVQIGQVATIVTVFGWIVNSLALFTRAYERYRAEMPTLPLVHLPTVLAAAKNVRYELHPIEYRFYEASFGTP